MMTARERRGFKGAYNGCLFKRAYPTQAQARRAATRTPRHPRRRGRLAPYLCDYCGLWHNGHRKPREEMQ